MCEPRHLAYLDTPSGEPTRDLLRMANEGPRSALRAAIYKAFSEQKEVVFQSPKLISLADPWLWYQTPQISPTWTLSFPRTSNHYRV